ncbi:MULTISPECIES: hypothetical protein [Nostocales]|uniref:Uncharacterized protein n=3 Tax=Nostocales TaxID=1161 RepID=A0A8S9T1E0_9CYAN|nr:hypothetical protein [Tolypothrix bouteillei]KAF3885807.1 hypothetical protein DA73_0400010250 [Tolypothrix bouteillei VB521301]
MRAIALLLSAICLARRAGQETYCYPVNQKRVSRDPAYHPRAYTDSYRQGLASGRKEEAYKPRTSGGEFARGFEDGYFGNPWFYTHYPL